MGTKADFYIKRGDDLEWQGSIEWDARIDELPQELLQSSSEYEFQEHLQTLLSKRAGAKRPEQGWPWYWSTSKQTDYSYIMWEQKGSVFITTFNNPAFTFYQYREYMSRYKKAKANGTSIEDLRSYMDKVGHFVPNFPDMRKTLGKTDHNSGRSNSSPEDDSCNGVR